MSERTTKVSLIANVNGYVAGMEKARKKTAEMADDSSQKLAQQRQAFDQVGVAALAMGAVAAAGVAVAVKAFADFDSKLSNIQAATNETSENMALLKDAAIEAGRETAFSAGEAADAITEMAKAGVATADILGGGLTGALNLAAAGEISVGRAAEIAATALTQFKLAGSDVPRVADLLSAGANKAQGGVEDLSNALSQGGLVAAATGLTLEETVGTLSAFASAGLLGGDAGTSFKSMLQRLTPVSAEAKEEMERLGISAFDANGQFIGMSEFAGNLQTSLKDLTPEQRNASQAIIFGTDAVRAANILYEQGAEGIDGWVDAVDDAGNAARTAELKLDNLNGDLQILAGSFETALIQSGSAANDSLRFLVQTATEAVNAFSDMDPAAQGAALGAGALFAAASLGVGAFFTLVPKVAAFNESLAVMGPGAVRAGRATVGVAKGLAAIAAAGVAITVIDKIADSMKGASLTGEEMTQTLLAMDLDAPFESIGQSVGTMDAALENLFANDFNSAFQRWFGDVALSSIGVSGYIQEARDSFDNIGVSLGSLVNSGQAEKAANLFDQIAAAAAEQGISTEEVLDLMPAYRDALAGVDNEQKLAAQSGEAQAEALAQIEAQAEETQQAVDDLSDAIRNFGQTQLDVNSAQRGFEQALDDATDALEANGATLDVSTQAGRDNQAALDDIVVSTNEYAAAIFYQTGSIEDASAALARGREDYIRVGEQMGLTREQAEKYADALIATPEVITTQAVLTGVEKAETEFLDFIRRANGSRINITPNFVQRPGQFIANANGGLHSYANGGMAPGVYAGGTPMYKFAEPETRWEAFISGKPGQEGRNRGVLMEAAQRLGMVSPSYVSASSPQGGGGSRTEVNMNVRADAPATVAGLVVQALEARLAVG